MWFSQLLHAYNIYGFGNYIDTTAVHQVWEILLVHVLDHFRETESSDIDLEREKLWRKYWHPRAK